MRFTDPTAAAAAHAEGSTVSEDGSLVELSVEDWSERVVAALRADGQRLTAPRLAIIGWIAAQTTPFSAEALTAANERARRFYARCGLAPVQEIWRAELTPAPGATPSPDPSCEADGHAAHQIELGHHHLAMELGDCPEEERTDA